MTRIEKLERYLRSERDVAQDYANQRVNRYWTGRYDSLVAAIAALNCYEDDAPFKRKGDQS